MPSASSYGAERLAAVGPQLGPFNQLGPRATLLDSPPLGPLLGPRSALLGAA